MEKKNYLCSGNQYLAIPKIIENNGNIESLNCLYFKYNSLIEICADTNNSIIKPFFTINNNEIKLQDLKWYFDIYWIPHWEYKTEKIIIKGSILLPSNEKGFIYAFQVNNLSNEEINVKIGFKGNIKGLLRTIYSSEFMNLSKKIFLDKWENEKMVINFSNEATIFSIVIMPETKPDFIGWNKNIDYYLNSNELFANIYEPVNYCVYKDFKIKPNNNIFYRYYIGCGIEQSSASSTVIHLNRITYNYLYNETKEYLKQKIQDVRDIQLNYVMNKNLLFNYFYSFGKTIDTEELVCITSRSPLYYVNSAFWDRDIFLWSLPGLLLSDKNLGREVFEYFFKYQIKNVGIHSRYINGSVLESGFELDELCAPIIGLDYYTNFTNDFDYLKKEYVLEGIENIIQKIFEHKNKNYFLFETFLLPTDDVTQEYYVTYDNVLVWKVFKIIEKFAEHFNLYSQKEKFSEYANRVKEAIYAYLVFEKKNKKLFAWSTDLKGNYRFYDEAAGSLVLLNYYGFCEKDNDIYLNTIRELYSAENKYFIQSGNFNELTNLHTPQLTPWILSAINSALTIRKNEVKNFIRNAKMYNGIACESIYPDTGEAATGEHFATCAGFLGYSIWFAYR